VAFPLPSLKKLCGAVQCFPKKEAKIFCTISVAMEPPQTLPPTVRMADT
jgi:hypothetical protein